MRKNAFSWYGGKYTHLNFILPHIPKNAQCFVEVCGGSGVVLWNLPPFPVEVFNDLNGEVVHFFRMLRDFPEELIRLISLTPWSREELSISRKVEEVSDIERARRFYVRTSQTMNGVDLGQKGGSSWSYTKSLSRRGMSLLTSKWLNRPLRLQKVAERILRVQIENLDAVEVIKKYDTEQTVFYVDPPYLTSTRKVAAGYGIEMKEEDHERLAEILNNVEGKVVLSGYSSSLYEKWFSGWRQEKGKEKRISVGDRKQTRQEVLWMNFE